MTPVAAECSSPVRFGHFGRVSARMMARTTTTTIMRSAR